MTMTTATAYAKTLPTKAARLLFATDNLLMLRTQEECQYGVVAEAQEAVARFTKIGEVLLKIATDWPLTVSVSYELAAQIDRGFARQIADNDSALVDAKADLAVAERALAEAIERHTDALEWAGKMD
jgi:hypothetical protein